MSFVVRSVEEKDLKQLHQLAGQFQLLNVPADELLLEQKITRSLKSFAGKAKRDDAEYLFVLEDLEIGKLIGCSLVMAKHGTRKVPHNYFQVIRKDKFSEELGVGFIHQILKFKQNSDGPTEVGGLLVDRSYRRRPEKLGRQISLIRFLYIGMNPDRFEKRLLVELTAPLTSEGRSEFWEALGRRFTGLPYQEADRISQVNKEFIKSLFPEEEIYATLLDSRARLVLGRVGEETLPAKHLLESIGFKYLHEVDPFDGGPHYGSDVVDVTLIKNGGWKKIAQQQKKTGFTRIGLAGLQKNGAFKGIQTLYDTHGEDVALPQSTLDLLRAAEGDQLYVTPLE